MCACSAPARTPVSDGKKARVATEPPAAEGTPQPAEASGEKVIALPEQDSSLVDPVSLQGQRARGVYLTGPYIRYAKTPKKLIQLVRRTGSNAVVIDMKDDQGRVFFDTRIADIRPQYVRHIRNPQKLIAEFKQAGIYTIGRIVCFSDPQLPRRAPDRAVIDSRPHKRGAPWVSWGNGSTWLDPHNAKNQQMIVGMAKEVAALGFDEIQLDYIRFPVDPGTRFAKFPAETAKLRRYVLRDLLRQVDAAIRVPLSVDVFGLTAFRRGDPTGLGQSLEDWTDYVEIFSPMLYANNMKSWGRHIETGRAGALVQAGVATLRNRIGPGPVIRPFLQAFSAGADYFNADFIGEQIVGARTGGADGYLFWHPASNYGTVGRAMRRNAVRQEFPIERRAQWRERMWDGRSATLRQPNQ